jgi:chaperonin GroEL
MLGKARKVISTKDSTVVVGGKGKKSEIEARVNQIRKQRDNSSSKYDKQKLEERIAKLSGGVAVIRVGAATETEMKYLKLKIEDAVNATKAAIEEGIVAGGGVALVKVAGRLAEWLKNHRETLSPEIILGHEIVTRALEAPLRQIVINTGKEDGSVIIDKVKHGKGNIGYDALKDEMVGDVIAAGIVDPVKVTRLGVENACSAAAILLTTEAAVADDPEEKKDVPANPGMGGMGY